jgi:hypothetical protein
MTTRWNTAKRQDRLLNVPCSLCGQMFYDVGSASRHQSVRSSNCGKTQRIHNLALSALHDQITVGQQTPSPSIIDISDSPIDIPDSSIDVVEENITNRDANLSVTFMNLSRALTTLQSRPIPAPPPAPPPVPPPLFIIGNIHITADDMTSLSSDGELVEDNIIDAFQNILQQQDWNSFYFHLGFFQCLVTAEKGYDFYNVHDWTRDINIYTKKFLYIPVVMNAHYILIVPDIESKIIRCYDPLGTNRKQLMQFVLLYLHDMFYMIERAPHDTSVFEMSEWSFTNIFTPTSKIQLNSIDCGIFLIKFVQLLGKSINITSLSQDNVSNYRKELVTLIESHRI